MLDIQLLRTDLDRITQQLAARNFQFPVERFNQLELERKKSKLTLRNCKPNATPHQSKSELQKAKEKTYPEYSPKLLTWEMN